MTRGSSAIRVIVPCHQADSTLGECLKGIKAAWLESCELVLVDDGKNSSLNDLAARFCASVVRTAGRRSAGAARNAGARGFAGEILVFVDADVVPATPDALAQLTAPLLGRNAAATVGRYGETKRESFAATYKQRYLAYTYRHRAGDLRNTFWSALCAVRREVFEAVGGFNESYEGAGPEDIDFGMSLTARGEVIQAVPAAVGHHLKALTLGGLVRNDLAKGCEDVYVHWARRIPITENRHAGTADILAVALAGCLLLSLFAAPWIGPMPACALALGYIFSRQALLGGAFGAWGLVFFAQAVLATFMLDIVRGVAVLLGTALWAVECFSDGRWKPFQKRGDIENTPILRSE